ncbi:MAG: CU044_5270 family protein [Acidimicrobiia bacterium]
MSDLATELRDYVDAVAPPISEEEIRHGARILVPRPRAGTSHHGPVLGLLEPVVEASDGIHAGPGVGQQPAALLPPVVTEEVGGDSEQPRPNALVGMVVGVTPPEGDGKGLHGEVEAAWRALAERLGLQRPVERRQATRRRWAMAAGVAAAAVTIAVAVPAVLPGGPGGASPAAAQALRRLARVAANQAPEPVPAPGQHLYSRSTSQQTSLYVVGNDEPSFQFTRPLTRESWIGLDGSGRIRETVGEITFPTPEDRAAWERAGRPDLDAGETSDDTYEPGELFRRDLSEFPTDAEQLLRVLEKRELVGGDGADWVTFQIIGELLTETHASPKLRGALYEVAANFAGVEFRGRMRDDAGREGISVAYGGGGWRQELVFDPDTSRLLAARLVMLDGQEAGVSVGPDTSPGTIIAFGPPGTVVHWALYFESAVVDSIDERP